MATTTKQPDFYTSEQGIITLKILNDMVADSAYKTDPSYSAKSAIYPNNLQPFVDKHMTYLRDHPKTDPNHYISNLRLMTRLKNPGSASSH